MGIGIAIMHYSGMAAMQMPANLHYKPSLFVLSVIIAIAVSLVALKLSIQFREEAWVSRKWLKLVTACIMGTAVLSMHYTGMAAAMFKPDVSKLVQAAGLDNLSLAYIVCLFTLLILSLTLATIYINSSDRRRLID